MLKGHCGVEASLLSAFSLSLTHHCLLCWGCGLFLQPLGTDQKTMMAIMAAANKQLGDNSMITVSGFTPWVRVRGRHVVAWAGGQGECVRGGCGVCA